MEYVAHFWIGDRVVTIACRCVGEFAYGVETGVEKTIKNPLKLECYVKTSPGQLTWLGDKA